MKLIIKNMVCNRCISAVEKHLTSSGFSVLSISLGEAEVAENPGIEEKRILDQGLRKLGFELIGDRKTRLIESVKREIIETFNTLDPLPDRNFSEYLAEKFHQDYSGLSRLFSEIQGTTLEKYIIQLKIEKTKELLVYGELTLSEIAYRLNYSSVSHLSSQFKKVTGLTPTHFKKIKVKRRIPLDRL